MTPRKLEFKGNPNATSSIEDASTEKKSEEKQENTSGKLTKGERKALKIAEKKAEKLALREKGTEGEQSKAEEEA
jgi:tryptophanyl-tRNA synthetase